MAHEANVTNVGSGLQATVARLRHFRPSDLAKIRAASNDRQEMLRVADAFSNYLVSLREPKPADIDDVIKIFAQLRSTGAWNTISPRVLIAQLKDRVHPSIITAISSDLPANTDFPFQEHSGRAFEASGFAIVNSSNYVPLKATHYAPRHEVASLKLHHAAHYSAQVYMVVDKGTVVAGLLEPSKSAITDKRFRRLPGKVSAFDIETKTGVFFAGKSYGRLLFSLETLGPDTHISTSEAYQFSMLSRAPI